MKLYICTKFHGNIDENFKVIEWTRFEINFFFIFLQKTLQELCFLFSAYSLMILYIFTKFHENSFDCIKVIEWTRFSLGKFQRDIIPQIW